MKIFDIADLFVVSVRDDIKVRMMTAVIVTSRKHSSRDEEHSMLMTSQLVPSIVDIRHRSEKSSNCRHRRI